MSVAVESVRSELAALVGPSRVMAERADCAGLAVDGKVPDCAVLPSTAEQVAAILHYACQNRLAVIPRGNGTKLGIGNVPRRYDVALCLGELNRVVHYEPADLTITVEPGMNLGAFQELVGRSGFWIPLDPRGGAAASIGGIIAANAAGPLRQGFGGPRDVVLGLKIATTDGKVVKTGGRVVKNVAGYDFSKLLTGSYGTLGVIVETSLKLFPKPPERATFVLRTAGVGDAKELRRNILRSSLSPMRLVLMDGPAWGLVDGSGPARDHKGMELWIELGGSHRVIERCMLDLKQLVSTVGASVVRHDGAEEPWQCVANLAGWLPQKFPNLVVLKAALPLANTEDFLSRAKQESDVDKLAIAGFAQVGLGIVHVCLLEEASRAEVPAWVGRLRQAATDLHGTLVIEHCPTSLKGEVDVWGATGDDAGVMRSLKLAWDPQEVLSPGRFLGF